jgi:ATP-dependent exoDNAse (exonuclease V) beta subunit
LAKSYRATWQIGQAIAGLRSDPGDEEDRSSHAAPVFSGPKPVWIDADLQHHLERVGELIARLVHDGKNPVQPGLIAVIVRESSRCAAYVRHLREIGIDCVQIKGGEPLKVDQQHVHVVTAHSSKGLGFPIVIVPDVSALYYPPRHVLARIVDEEEKEDLIAMEQRLLYVALSRASHQLYLLADTAAPCCLLSKLDRDAYWGRE